MSFNNFGNNNFGGGLLSGGLTGGLGNGLVQQSYSLDAPTMVDNNQGAAISVEVRKVYLGLTRPQSQQHRRSYDVLLDGTGYNAIQEEVGRYGAEAFNPLNMGNLMSKPGAAFIRPSGTPDAAVNIDNGWDRERFRFTMVVDVYRAGRFAKTEFISGYTDHAGVTNAGLISTVAVDPSMVFTINHVTEARVRQMDNAGRPIALVSRANSVVRNNVYEGLGLNSQMYMTRPSDVLRAVDKVQMYHGMQQAAQFGSPDAMTYQDLDSMLTNVPMMSSDTNLLIPTFASRTLKGLYENSLNEFDPMNMDNQGAGSLAAMRIADTAFSTCSLIHVMNRNLANGVTTTAQFSYHDLLMLDPTIDDRTDIFGRSYETGAISIPDGRSVASLGESTTIAIHATSIAQTTLALMSFSGIATLAYNANNQQTGQAEVTFQACDGMDQDGGLAQRLEMLKTRLILECLNIVASDDASFNVDVFADAFNDVFIQLSWEGERRDYVFPAFASSSTAPIVTNDINRLVGMAEAIDDVVGVCKGIINPNSIVDSNGIAIQGNGESKYAGLAGDF
jgi:hypothetical protein